MARNVAGRALSDFMKLVRGEWVTYKLARANINVVGKCNVTHDTTTKFSSPLLKQLVGNCPKATGTSDEPCRSTPAPA